MDTFKESDIVIYQGEEVRITDSKPEEDQWRIAFNHGTHTTWKWVSGDEIAPRIKRTAHGLKVVLESRAHRLSMHDNKYLYLTDRNLPSSAGCTCHIISIEGIDRLIELLQEAKRDIQASRL
jgi:hypothetical protein